MSDIHVLTSTLDDRASVVFHFDVPNVNNAVGVNYRTALVASGLGGTTSLSGGNGLGGTISATEKTLVESGAVLEHAVSYPLESGGTTNAQLRATLRAFYASEETRVVDIVKRQLRYFGHTESKA